MLHAAITDCLMHMAQRKWVNEGSLVVVIQVLHCMQTATWKWTYCKQEASADT